MSTETIRGRFQGEVALVTGVGSQIGIGRSIAQALAAEGAIIAANDIVGEDLELTVTELRATGAEVSAHAADVADRAAVQEMVENVERLHGPIDILVNNAGIAKRAPFAEMSEAEYRRTLDVNLGGTFNCTQAVVRGMIARAAGRIVNLSSLMGSAWGWDDHVHYNAAKGGIEGLTRRARGGARPARNSDQRRRSRLRFHRPIHVAGALARPRRP